MSEGTSEASAEQKPGRGQVAAFVAGSPYGRLLGIELREVDIRPVYEAYLGLFRQLFGERESYGVAQENIQARIRGAGQASAPRATRTRTDSSMASVSSRSFRSMGVSGGLGGNGCEEGVAEDAGGCPHCRLSHLRQGTCSWGLAPSWFPALRCRCHAEPQYDELHIVLRMRAVLYASRHDQHLSIRELNGLRAQLNCEPPAVNNEDLILVIMLVPRCRADSSRDFYQRAIGLTQDALGPVRIDRCKFVGDVHLAQVVMLHGDRGDVWWGRVQVVLQRLGVQPIRRL